MSAQFILDDNRPRFAVLPIEEYERLVAADEMLEDIKLYDAAKARGDEQLPQEICARILHGESPVRVFREYRGLSQQSLADATGISAAYLCQIEQSQRRPSIGVFKKLASALGVDIDDLA